MASFLPKLPPTILARRSPRHPQFIIVEIVKLNDAGRHGMISDQIVHQTSHGGAKILADIDKAQTQPPFCELDHPGLGFEAAALVHHLQVDQGAFGWTLTGHGENTTAAEVTGHARRWLAIDGQDHPNACSNSGIPAFCHLRPILFQGCGLWE